MLLGMSIENSVRNIRSRARRLDETLSDESSPLDSGGDLRLYLRELATNLEELEPQVIALAVEVGRQK